MPLADNPKSDEVSLYRAIEQIVDELPSPRRCRARPATVVVVVGAPDQVPPAAEVDRGPVAPAVRDDIWRTGPAG